MALPAIITSLLPSLVSGFFGSQAARPAATAAESAAGAQANMVNMLMEQFKNIFGPAQGQLMNQFMGLQGQLPTSDLLNFQMIQDLLPTMLPDVLRGRAEQRVLEQGRGFGGQLERDISRRGLDPNSPAAMALRQRGKEQTIRGLHGVGSEAMTWEAGQTMANREKAFNRAMQMMGLAADYSQLGSALPGTAITGASDLAKMFGTSAQTAAAPWQQFGTDIGSALQNYFSTPSPYQIPTPSPYPSPYGGGGGGGFRPQAY